MADFEITSPDGKKFVVTAPEGATQDQVLSYAQSQFKAAPAEAPQAPVEKPTLTDKLTGGLMRGGPMGAVMAGFGHSMDTLGDAVTSGAYQAGDAVSRGATALGASPEVAGGAGMAANVALQAVPALAGGQMGKTAAPLVQAAGEKLMQSALKPTLKNLQNGNAERAVKTMLDEGINVTKGGVEKLGGMIDDIGTQVSSLLSKYSGTTVDKGAVASRIQDVVTRIEKTNPTPQSALSDVHKVYDDFMTNGLLPKNIGVVEANTLKSGIYKMLKDAYGQLGSNTVEAQKALARGFKEEINSAVPEVGKLTAKQGELINASKLAERRTLVEGNNNVLGLAPLAHGPGAAAAFLIDKYGLSKSLLARLLYSNNQAIPQIGGAATGGILQQLYQDHQ